MGKHEAVTNLGIHLFFITRAGLSQCIFLDLSIWDRVGAQAETRPRSWANPPDEHQGTEQGLRLRLPRLMGFVLQNMKPLCRAHPTSGTEGCRGASLTRCAGRAFGKEREGQQPAPLGPLQQLPK